MGGPPSKAAQRRETGGRRETFSACFSACAHTSLSALGVERPVESPLSLTSLARMPAFLSRRDRHTDLPGLAYWRATWRGFGAYSGFGLQWCHTTCASVARAVLQSSASRFSQRALAVALVTPDGDEVCFSSPRWAARQASIRSGYDALNVDQQALCNSPFHWRDKDGRSPNL